MLALDCIFHKLSDTGGISLGPAALLRMLQTVLYLKVLYHILVSMWGIPEGCCPYVLKVKFVTNNCVNTISQMRSGGTFIYASMRST